MASLVVIGIAGFALFRVRTPVTLDDAVDRFRAGNDSLTSGSYEVDPPKPQEGARSQALARGENAARANASHRAGAQPLARTADVAAATTDAQTSSFDVMPAEGVYRFEGSGEENINGISRPLDTESHRIVTHEDHDTWVEHHIFQEERQSWTRITTGATGRLVHSQRNLIGIAGQTVRDTDVPFDPPVQAVLFPHRVGHTWSDRFEGRSEPDGDDYSGTYRVQALGDEVWRVGNRPVRVFGYQMDVEFEGELEADVTVKYWFAPLHGVTVKEHYSIDATVEGLDYHAEWDVRLLSIAPHS